MKDYKGAFIKKPTHTTRDQSIQLFNHPLLEKLTHVHPLIPLLMWVPVILFLWYRSLFSHHWGLGMMSVFAFMGILSWTLAEYLLHRFIFHYPPQSRVSERLVYLFHGIHHDAPNEPTRLVMPPVPGILLGALFYSLFYGIGGTLFADPFFSFFVTGYLFYDYTHYAIHHFQPKTAWGTYVKRHHMLHHFSTPNAKWGVSTPLWDWVFGTLKSSSKSVKHG